MTDRCVFCGTEGGDFAPEHWIPDWLMRALIPKHGSSLQEMTVAHVCNSCNSHWLSDIETRARRYMWPLIMGTADKQVINPIGLEHVARWCYLKVISLELGRPEEHEPTHPTATYEAFKKTKRPPYPNCSLALGMRDVIETNPTWIWFLSQGLKIPTGPPMGDLGGYHTTLLIGHLVIDAMGTHVPAHLDVEHREGFQVLWPLMRDGGTFTWPPEHHFKGVVDNELV